MIASTHLASAAAAGLAVQGCLSSDVSNPERLFWAFAAGFVSHIVLDAIPHQEYPVGGLRLLLVLLLEIGVVFSLVLSFQNSLLLNLIIFFGMVGGALPDVMELVHAYLFNCPWLANLGSQIHFFHGTLPTGFKVNFYLQPLITLAAIIFVRSRPV